MDYINKKFNRVTILKDAGRDKHSHKLVEVQCGCENKTVFITRLNSVLNGHTTSCGCYHKEVVIKLNKKHNTYDLTGEYGIGYTSKGEEFYFDLEDYEKIKDICWYINNNNYVMNEKTSMQKLIINKDINNRKIEYVKLNQRDNRKSNLRIVKPSQNSMNRKGHGVMSKFGIKGIVWDKNNKKWHGQIQKERKSIYSKYFKNIKDVIEDKISFEKEYFGEYRYAWENNIDWNELLKYEKELKINLKNKKI